MIEYVFIQHLLHAWHGARLLGDGDRSPALKELSGKGAITDRLYNKAGLYGVLQALRGSHWAKAADAESPFQGDASKLRCGYKQELARVEEGWKGGKRNVWGTEMSILTVWGV